MNSLERVDEVGVVLSTRPENKADGEDKQSDQDDSTLFFGNS